MARLLLPISLRSVSDVDTVSSGGTIYQSMKDLVDQAPELRPHLFSADTLRPFIVVLVNGNDIRNLQGIETPVNDSDTIRVVASVAGG